MQDLTKAEEQIMLIIWSKENCFVKDILKEIPEPKPAYNTVSTIVRILEKKKYVSYTAFGKTHQYFAIIDKEEYKSIKADSLVTNLFGGSIESMLAFFVKDKKIDVKQMDELLKELKNK